MPIVGFNFDKILIERVGPVEGQIKVKRDLSVKDLQKEEIVTGAKKKEDVLKFNFEFSVKYDPNIGHIIILGHILFLDEVSVLKKVLDGWKKNKELPGNLTASVLNTALMRCNLKALSLIQDVSLPPHIQLPVISPKSKASDYIG